MRRFIKLLCCIFRFNHPLVPTSDSTLRSLDQKVYLLYAKGTFYIIRTYNYSKFQVQVQSNFCKETRGKIIFGLSGNSNKHIWSSNMYIIYWQYQIICSRTYLLWKHVRLGLFQFQWYWDIINTIINTIRFFKGVLCRLEKSYVGHWWFTNAALIM